MATLSASRLVDTSLARFGEAVTLPTGEAFAVVDLEGIPMEIRTRGTRQGPALPIAHQGNPVMHLRQEDAEALREQDPVTVRGVDYLVVGLAQDGAGVTRVDIMLPGAEPGPRPEWQQWR